MNCCKKLFMILVVIAVLILNPNYILAKSPNKSSSVPIAPTLLTYSNLTSSEATLNWTSSYSAVGYKLYRATPYDSNYTLIATLTTNSYKNVSLKPNTTYWYFVKAYNSYGTSLDSKHISLTTSGLSTSKN
ncbi:fibronectin type III domain-containing protein [Clostridium sp. DMHC 10]|uniref:fibronectin type III domain-containing protein n=1 Tax=Clostridium sp. DMHC 10 TaxID=747377 RepID=UPI000A49A34A|nr:fibronectin type III domain-containing protein [Clostridium sp. DMHC 10]